MQNGNMQVRDAQKRTASDNEPKPFLSVNEYWEALGRTISKSTLREWGHCGKLKTIRVGRKILIPASEVEELPARLAEGQ